MFLSSAVDQAASPSLSSAASAEPYAVTSHSERRSVDPPQFISVIWTVAEAPQQVAKPIRVEADSYTHGSAEAVFVCYRIHKCSMLENDPRACVVYNLCCVTNFSEMLVFYALAVGS